jgi:hypothetical protein
MRTLTALGWHFAPEPPVATPPLNRPYAVTPHLPSPRWLQNRILDALPHFMVLLVEQR